MYKIGIALTNKMDLFNLIADILVPVNFLLAFIYIYIYDIVVNSEMPSEQ